MPALKPKPARDFPSMNALHAVRGSWDVANPQNSLPLTRGQYIPIGTIPANAHIIAASVHVSTGALAAGATLDLAVGESTYQTALLTGQSLDAAGNFPASGTPGLGFSPANPARRIVFARLTSAAPLTAGAFNALVQYYAKQD